MEKVFIPIKMEINMKVNFKMVHLKDKESTILPMAIITQEIFKMEDLMDKEPIFTLINQKNMWANGKTINIMEKELYLIKI